jgi:FkbM family methyltransferase
MIHIGDYWGRKYDNIRHTKSYQLYQSFRRNYGIQLVNWNQCPEVLVDPLMYIQDEFKPEKGDIVWDAGSQYGDYALIWEKFTDTPVIGFELNTKNYNYMAKNFRVNKSKNIAVNVALGEGNELSYKMDRNMARQGNESVIKTKTLDSFLDTYGAPNYLKIDVEGFEISVLKGASKILGTVRPKIIIETHSFELKKQVMQMLIDKYGYSLKIEGRSFAGRGFMDNVQNLFFIPPNDENHKFAN